MALQLKGKLWQTSEGKQALALIAGKKTLGDQLEALGAQKALNPSSPLHKTKGTQSYANKMLYFALLEDFFDKYEKFTDKSGKKWDLGAPYKNHSPYPEEWAELLCFLRAPWAGAYDYSDESWYTFEAATMQNACKAMANRPSLTWQDGRRRSYDWALSHLKARDPKAANLHNQIVRGAMIQKAQASEESQKQAFQKGVQDTITSVVTAPLKAVEFIIPTWIKVAAVGALGVYIYLLYTQTPLSSIKERLKLKE